LRNSLCHSVEARRPGRTRITGESSSYSAWMRQHCASQLHGHRPLNHDLFWKRTQCSIGCPSVCRSFPTVLSITRALFTTNTNTLSTNISLETHYGLSTIQGETHATRDTKTNHVWASRSKHNFSGYSLPARWGWQAPCATFTAQH
jgi:hypothetical protein